MALAPNVRFVVSLTHSPTAGEIAACAVFALYVASVFVPSLRRISNTNSFVALILALLLAAFAMGFSKPIKETLATAAGFYGKTLPWSSTSEFAPGSTWTYENAFGGYSLQIPRTWSKVDGPAPGTVELLLKNADGSIAARLRPSCDRLDDPMPVTVEWLRRANPHIGYDCGRWTGLDACLLADNREDTSGSRAVQWDWLGRDPSTGGQVRLLFSLSNDAARRDALSIIKSVRRAANPSNAWACPNPIEWAEPF